MRLPGFPSFSPICDILLSKRTDQGIQITNVKRQQERQSQKAGHEQERTDCFVLAQSARTLAISFRFGDQQRHDNHVKQF